MFGNSGKAKLLYLVIYSTVFSFNNLTIITYMKNIPNNLRECRKNAGLTQLEVAEKLGFKSTERISKWEKGVKYPNVANLFRIARIYRVNAEELYNEI